MANPKPIITPFAENGTRNDIPEAGADQPQKATMSGGWGVITQTPINEGGIPPERADFNGLGHLTTSHLAFLNRGQWYGYDANLSGKIGGYPLHARLMLDNGDIVKSTIPNNINNPNINKTGWESGEGSIIDLSETTDLTPSHITDLIQSSINKSTNNPVKIIFPNSIITLDNKLTAPTNSKGLCIDLNGSTVKAPNESIVVDVGYFFDLMCPDSNLLIIENGIIDGSNRAQNLFEVTNPADLAKGCSGISAQSKNVIFRNLTIQHMYGQTTRTVCRNFVVDNVFINDCGGHWYANDGYDYFGDAFYIATGWNDNGIINAKFNNTTVVAKYSSQYPENHQSGSPLTQVQYSRIGITLEKFYGTNSNKVYISLKNCDFQFLERGFHQEANGIDSYIHLSNTRFDSCVLFGAYLTDTMHSFSSFCNFGLYDSEYNGSKGLARGFSGSSKATMEYCEINQFGENNSNALGMTATLNAYYCNFNNITGLWCNNSILNINYCNFNIKNNPSEPYYAWDSALYVENSRFNYSGNYVHKNGQTQSYKRIINCEFENILLPSGSWYFNKNFMDNTFIASNSTGVDFKDTLFSNYNVYNSAGLLIKKRCGLWGVSYGTYKDSRIYYFNSVRTSNTVPIDIVNQGFSDFIKNNSLCLLVLRGGHGDSVSEISKISSTEYGFGYYVGIVKFDEESSNKVRLIGDVISVGSTSSSGFGLSVSSDLKVTALGEYATYLHRSLIPFREKDTLPFVPDQLI